MTISHKPENTTKTNVAHPSLGKACEGTTIFTPEVIQTTSEAAMASGILSKRGFWARPTKDENIKVITIWKTSKGEGSTTHLIKPNTIYEFIAAYGDIDGYAPKA
jgi:hypothetical protein